MRFPELIWYVFLMQKAALAYGAVFAHRHSGAQTGVCADMRAPLDDAQRPYRGTGMHLGQSIHHRAGMYATLRNG